MKKERNAVKAGLFILAAIALSVGVVLSIKGTGRFTEARQERVASFRLADDLGGLREGDEVRVGGLRVGSVRKIEPVGLDGDDPHLLVHFDLPAKFAFRENARLGVQTTLTGSSVLNVDSLGKGAALKDGEQLVGIPDPKSALFAGLAGGGGTGVGADVAAITKTVRETTLPKVNDSVDTYKKTGEAATALVNHVKEQVKPAMDKYDTVATKAGGMMDSVHEMIGPSTKDFHGTMADLHELTGDLKAKLPGMITKVEGAIDGTQKALTDVQTTVANTRDISGSVRSLIAGNHSKLDGMIGSLSKTGKNLEAASVEIRRSPWRLLYQPKQDELHNQNLYDSARQFAEGANDLNDAAQALKDAVNSKDADPQHVQALVNRLEKTFENFHQVEDKLWQGVKE